MTQTAEAQILAAAHSSLQSKSAELAGLDPDILHSLTARLQPFLGDRATSCAGLLHSIGSAGDSLSQLAALSLDELHGLHAALEACYRELYPPTPAIPQVKSLSLLEFDSEDDDEGFTLLDFDAEAEAETESRMRAALRRPLWLLAQLIAAESYIRQTAA